MSYLIMPRHISSYLIQGAAVASKLLSKAFSFECWGGATFDVAYRFLYEVYRTREV